MKFELPSEDDVRARYGIPKENPIELSQVDELPKPSRLKQIGAHIEEAASFFGVPTFFLRKAGLIIAILFLPYWGPKVQEEVKTAVVITQDYWLGGFQQLPHQNPEEPATRYAIVTQGPNTVSQSISMFETGVFPTGTQIHPISGYLG